ncbi:TPA: carbohydrate ABC transporter substrate-binding protein [Candidatus Bipolaricaulota bacterium]|nr:carbohydrate ABC transporter substrate-binding protein [Candidatus Bipolaricaulota bacterium]
MKLLKIFGLVFLLTVVGALLTFSEGQKIVFYSTQLRPIEEAEWVRGTLLPPFTEETGIEVEFIPDEYSPWADRLIAEYKAWKADPAKCGVDLAGGLHGDFMGVLETPEKELRFVDLSAKLAELSADRTFIESFVELGKMAGIQAYIPWMQATYLTVINKKAMDYLPYDVNIESLSYDDLLKWAKSIYDATGEKKLGIPAGPKSLLHRFVHGYLYPSFTCSTVKKFMKKPEVLYLWGYAKTLWQYVHPEAAKWDAMAEPLLEEAVWIAWDHTARVWKAIEARPEDFIAVPSPADCCGRGFISVLAGLGIPKAACDPDSANKLIEYLTKPEVQVVTLEGVAFFPIVEEAAGKVPAGPAKVLAEGVTKQAAAPDAIVAMIPGGLGARAGEFSKIYRDTFTEIVIKGRNIEEVLEEQGKLLAELYRDTGAPCPLPDDPTEAPCIPEGF